jgi:hypothetical protein
MEREAQLFHVVLATHSRGRLTDFLHRGQQESDQNRDDGNYNQQLDQSKPGPELLHDGLRCDWKKHADTTNKI